MKVSRKLTALLLSLTMLFSCAFTAGAAGEEETRAMGYTGDSHEAPVSQRANMSYFGSEEETTLPAKYDLRDVEGKSYMTAVRDQGEYGTCWAHAVIASAESNLLMKGYKGYEDLSELQLVYFTYERSEEVAAEGGGTAGDVVNFEPYTSNSTTVTVLDRGGNSEGAANAMSARLGLIQETGMSYTDSSLLTAVKNGTLASTYARSLNEVALENVYQLNIKENAEAVKKKLMELGAAATSYWSEDETYLGTDGVSYYSNLSAVDVGGGTMMVPTNHAVTLCGWDDDYDRANFNNTKGATPSANGAWLCKNSWGTTLFGDDGYFWVSYEDTSMVNAFFFDVIPAEEDYDNLYQYDGGTTDYYTGYSMKSYGANIFTAEGDELLKAVRFELYNADAVVTVKVYTGVTDGKPTSGTLQSQATTTGSYNHAGTYTLELKEPVELTQGMNFSVVMTVEVDDGAAWLTLDRPDTGNPSSSAVITGKSFFGYNGTTWSSTDYDLRLKALTDDPEEFIPTGVAGDVNGDGELTIADAVLVMRYLLEKLTLEEAQRTVADVTGDGYVTNDDVSLILQAVVGLETLEGDT